MANLVKTEYIKDGSLTSAVASFGDIIAIDGKMFLKTNAVYDENWDKVSTIPFPDNQACIEIVSYDNVTKAFGIKYNGTKYYVYTKDIESLSSGKIVSGNLATSETQGKFKAFITKDWVVKCGIGLGGVAVGFLVGLLIFKK